MDYAEMKQVADNLKFSKLNKEKSGIDFSKISENYKDFFSGRKVANSKNINTFKYEGKTFCYFSQTMCGDCYTCFYEIDAKNKTITAYGNYDDKDIWFPVSFNYVVVQGNRKV